MRVQSNGSLLVMNTKTPSTFIRRLSSGGASDATFGASGTLTLTGQPPNGPFNVVAWHLPTSPTAPLAVVRSTAIEGSYAVSRFTANGAVDNSFGTNGTVTATFVDGFSWSFVGLVRLSDGSFLVTAVGNAGADFTEMIHITSTGSVDAAFGTGGVAKFPQFAGKVAGLTTDQRVVFSVVGDFGAFSKVARVSSAGVFDSSYGTAGLAAVPAIGDQHQMFVQPDGSVVVAARTFNGGGMSVSRLAATGATDMSFGVAGTVQFDFAGLYLGSTSDEAVGPISVQAAPGNRLVVFCRTPVGAAGAAMLLLDGTLDASFGVGGRAVISSDLDLAAGTTDTAGGLLSLGLAAGRMVLQHSTDRMPWPPVSPPPANFQVRTERLLDTVGVSATWTPVPNPDPEVVDGYHRVTLTRITDGVTMMSQLVDGDVVGLNNVRHGSYRFAVNAGNSYTEGTPAVQSITVPRWNRTVTPLNPRRVVDSRPTGATDDGQYEGMGQLAAGSTTVVHLWGRGGVDTDAIAAGINVTAVSPTANGFVTVYPCNAPRPLASNINYIAGTTVAGASIATIDPTGGVCVYTSAATHLLIDITSEFVLTTHYTTLTPARLADSRPTGTTIDGISAAMGRLGPGSTTVVRLGGRGSLPPHPEAVAITMTAVAPESNGFMSVFPCSAVRPNVANLNFTSGRTTSNSTLAVPDANGDICVYTSAAAHLVLDASGALVGEAAYSTAAAGRLIDTRPNGATVDGLYQGAGMLPSGTTTVLRVGGRGNVAADAVAASLNISAVAPVASGFVTVWRCDLERPNTSNINFAVGRTIANSAVATLDDQGDVCVYNSAPTQLVIDVNGAFTSDGF
ncbi:MAG: hypothetical protein HY828_17255 [Actinobacteria bacterium]|nr:hypothetical protein [Actinomycetota bacterium]